MKAPERTTTELQERALRLVEERGIVRMRDVIEAGIHPMVIRGLVERGDIERPVRGVYTHPSFRSGDTPTAAVAARTPKAVVCLLSAASIHGLVTRPPTAVWLAVPKRARRPSIKRDAPPMVVVGMDPETVDNYGIIPDEDLGIEERDLGGGQRARVTCPARTVADLFAFVGREFRMPDGSAGRPVSVELAVEAYQTAVANGVGVDEILRWARYVRSEQAVQTAVAAGRSMRW